MHVDGDLLEPLDNIQCFLPATDSGPSVLVTFMLPLPPMLPRGWARHIARKKTLDLTSEQRSFMSDCWVEGNKITAAVLREKMDMRFAGREELQLLENEVQRFLQSLYREANGVGEGEGDEDDDVAEGEENAVCGRRRGGAQGAGRGAGRPAGRTRGRDAGRGTRL
eukprot:1184263-Prorocentrum_minimum.AAC.1